MAGYLWLVVHNGYMHAPLHVYIYFWTNDRQPRRRLRHATDTIQRTFIGPPNPQYVDHPADYCFKLPESMDYELGAMCEPLSVGVHACRRGGVCPGKRVLVLGAGPIGKRVLMIMND